jgi:hypothetical protein
VVQSTENLHIPEMRLIIKNYIPDPIVINCEKRKLPGKSSVRLQYLKKKMSVALKRIK